MQQKILILIILAYLINGIFSINNLSITFDEQTHLSFGERMLKGLPGRLSPEKDNSKMPISALNALPRAAEQIVNPGLQKSDNGAVDIFNGRYITLLFSVLTILLVFKWSCKLYGANAGLFSAFLFSMCPNNAASAVLVTTDSYAAFFLPATMYCLWKYCNSKLFRDFILFAVLLALSQLAMQSLFHLYVLVPLCLFIFALAEKQKINVKAVSLKLLLAICISWLLINAGFLFYKVNNTVGSFHFMSNFFIGLQQLLPAWFPLPVSQSFVEGLDQAKYYDQLGGGLAESSFGNVTILNRSVTGGAVWYYFFVTIFFKTPVPYFFFIGFALYYLFTKEKFISFFKNEFFLLAPVVYYLLYMGFLYRTQCGIRHIIFIYPLLFIFCGIIFKNPVSRIKLFGIATLCLLLIISTARYFNNYYAYTNEFVFDKKDAYKIVGASNLNFSQADGQIRTYLQQHPEVKPAPLQPQPGKFLIVVDDFLDIWNTGKYKWMNNLQPAGHVAFCYLLFDVKQSDIGLK